MERIGILTNMTKPMAKEKNIFNYAVIFILGLLLAGQAFMTWQYVRLVDENERQRADIIQIVQSYNNLVTLLQQQEVITTKPTTPAN